MNPAHSGVHQTSFVKRAEEDHLLIDGPMQAHDGELIMFDPYLDARFDSKAFPPLARAISLVFSTAVVGAVLLEAFWTAAAIVA